MNLDIFPTDVAQRARISHAPIAIDCQRSHHPCFVSESMGPCSDSLPSSPGTTARTSRSRSPKQYHRYILSLVAKDGRRIGDEVTGGAGSKDLHLLSFSQHCAYEPLCVRVCGKSQLRASDTSHSPNCYELHLHISRIMHDDAIKRAWCACGRVPTRKAYDNMRRTC